MRGTSGIARIVGLGLVGSMMLSACVAPTGAVQRQPDDHSFDQIEQMRSVAGHAAEPDTSFEQVEHSRGIALSGQAAQSDTSYEQVEQLRGGESSGQAAQSDTSSSQLWTCRSVKGVYWAGQLRIDWKNVGLTDDELCMPPGTR